MFTFKSCLDTLDCNALLHIVFDQSQSQELFERLNNLSCHILASDAQPQAKSLVLRLYLILFTVSVLFFTSSANFHQFQCCEDIDTNVFIESLMHDKLFDALMHSFGNNAEDDWRILFLMVICLNYKKQSTNNIFAMKLSIVDNETCLSCYSNAILNELITFNKTIERLCSESKNVLISAFTSMMGTLFSSTDTSSDVSSILGKRMSFKTITIALLAFYEAVLLNRNFISLLTVRIDFENYNLIRFKLDTR